MNNIENDITKPISGGPTAKWSYISLIFSLFYFFPVVINYDRYSLFSLAVVLAIYSLFLIFFLIAVNKAGVSARLPIVLIILVSALGAGHYSGTNSLFGFASFFSGYYFRTKESLLFLLFSLMTQLSSAYAFDLMTIYYLGPGCAVAISLHIYGRFSRKETLHYLKQEQQNQQIEQLAAIAERERIARDMHDLLGHSLSSLALKSELAQKLIDKGRSEQAREEISQVAQLARETLSEVREAVTGLKQQSLDTGLNQLAEKLQHLGFDIKLSHSDETFNAKVESVLLMVCKEWVTNILRHSNGNKASIDTNVEGGKVILTVKDNGTVKQITPGNGIKGIQSRVSELSGTVEIESKDGVKLTVILPLTYEKGS